jgi:hypothetical protein
MLEIGQIVKVQTFMDGIVERRVVGMGPGVIYLCNESEFQSAKGDDREPEAIGFPLVDVVENEDFSTTEH